MSLLTPDDRRVLDAYVGGVNSGLTALGASPFEYLLLRQEPRPWVAADSMLVVLSMFLTLQDDDGSYETHAGDDGGRAAAGDGGAALTARHRVGHANRR